MEKGTISSVKPNSIAAELDIKPGDQLLEINDSPLGDIIDYYLAINDEEISLTVRKQIDGRITVFDIEKDYDEDLGIIFDPPTIDTLKQCSNNCKFCFVRQMPKGMRPSLYIRDDDYRLSFLYGSYITGTNLSEAEIERICQLHLSPLYISVHRTDDRRKQLIGNDRAVSIMNLLERFCQAGIEFHTQIVLCPEENDGAVLRQSIEDLLQFMPNILSLAIVPVGLTRYRDNLPSLRCFTTEEAQAVLKIITGFNQQVQRQWGKNLIYGSDEFYLLAKQPVPEADYYEGFVQIENGVGMVRAFSDSLDSALVKWQQKLSSLKLDNYQFLLATGTLAAPFMESVMKKIQAVNESLQYQVCAIENNFFGLSVTVAGLVTSQDIIAQLAPLNKENAILLIPDTMLKFGTDLFLDDQSIADVERALNLPICVVANGGEQLIEEIMRCGVS